MDENIFKLLTNPTFFNEQLHWQKRRETLLQICGDISDDDVIASDKTLAGLMQILNVRSLEDHRKVIAARRSEINKELERIPVRIDEALRGLPDITNIPNSEVLAVEIASLKVQMQEKQQEIVRIENGGEVAEKQRQLREIEGLLLDIQNKHRAEYGDKAYIQKSKMQELKLQSGVIDSQINMKQRLIANNNQAINENEESRAKLREQFHAIEDKGFEFCQDTNCPTCGQGLPKDQIEAVKEKALSQFNFDKSQRLAENNTKGKQLKATAVAIQANNETLQADIVKLTADKADLEQSIAKLQTELDNMDAAPDLNTNSEYTRTLQDKEAIQAQIEQASTQKQGVIRQLQSEVSIFAQEISTRESKLVVIDQHGKGQKRITELEAEQKTLAAEFEKLESEL
ncbi:MAG: AAA family ATPase, partial [Sporomusa sp.]